MQFYLELLEEYASHAETCITQEDEDEALDIAEAVRMVKRVADEVEAGRYYFLKKLKNWFFFSFFKKICLIFFLFVNKIFEISSNFVWRMLL